MMSRLVPMRSMFFLGFVICALALVGIKETFADGSDMQSAIEVGADRERVRANSNKRAINKAKEQAEEEVIEKLIVAQKAKTKALLKKNAWQRARVATRIKLVALAKAKNKFRVLKWNNSAQSPEVVTAKETETDAEAELKEAREDEARAKDASRKADAATVIATKEAVIAELAEAQAIKETTTAHSQAIGAKHRSAVKINSSKAVGQRKPFVVLTTIAKTTSTTRVKAAFKAKERAEEEATEALMVEQKAIARLRRKMNMKHHTIAMTRVKVRALAKATGRRKALSRFKGKHSIEVKAAEMVETKAAEQVQIAREAQARAQEQAKVAEAVATRATEEAAVAEKTESQAIEQAEEAEAGIKEKKIAALAGPSQAIEQVKSVVAFSANELSKKAHPKAQAKAQAKIAAKAKEQAAEDAIEALMIEQKAMARAKRAVNATHFAKAKTREKVRALAQAMGRRKALGKLKGMDSIEMKAAGLVENQAVKQLIAARKDEVRAQERARVAEAVATRATEEAAVAELAETLAVEEAEEAEASAQQASREADEVRAKASVVYVATGGLNEATHEEVVTTGAVPVSTTPPASQSEFLFFVPGDKPGTGSWFTASTSLLKQAKRTRFMSYNK